MKKSIVSFLIMMIIIMSLIPNRVQATSERYEYDGTITYPGYKERIDAIKSNHPNWTFVIMKTGLDWNDVINNEYTGHHESPKNLIQGKSGGWICSICGQEIYDTGEWMCASEQTIRYYMDPRNWLVDSPYLFQFLKVNYDETSDEDVYAALNGTFLYSIENARLINKVCKEGDANPYFIIARIIQEQGNAGGETYRMQDTDGKVYYNLFNIGAGGNGNEVYTNALNKAKEMGWTSIESCIRGGISFLLSSYIGYMQNTIYLNKFDVESYKGLYIKQYMQNIEAPKTEGTSMYNKMKKANLLDKKLTFIIPVYENMPEIASYSPDTIGELYPKNIRVKEGHSRIVIRAGRSTTTSVIGYINDSDTIVLSVERYSDGWHKIILIDGTKGYVKFNSSYLEEVDDVVNCKEQMKLVGNAVLRVGPGIDQTEITALSKDEVVTRIDSSGIYNFNGYIWDRIRIADGRQGFILRNYLEQLIISKEENNIEEVNQVNEIQNQVNKIPENEIDENKETNDFLENEIHHDEEFNEINNNETEQENEISQNKIAEQNEIEENNQVGENEIEENNQTERNEIEENSQNKNNIGNDNNNQNINETTEQRERNYVIISPEKKAKDLEGIVTKNGIETEEAGTGYVLEKEGEKYIIVKKGDVNGDGYVKANDYLIIKDYIMGQNGVSLENEYIEAADVTGDKLVKANDYLKIKDHIMYDTDL